MLSLSSEVDILVDIHKLIMVVEVLKTCKTFLSWNKKRCIYNPGSTSYFFAFLIEIPHELQTSYKIHSKLWSCRNIWGIVFLVHNIYVLVDDLCVSVTVGGNLTLQSAFIFLDKEKIDFTETFVMESILAQWHVVLNKSFFWITNWESIILDKCYSF